jgi:alpha 1,2-mannosyltransferase
MLLNPLGMRKAAIRVTLVTVSLGIFFLYLSTPQRALSGFPPLNLGRPERLYTKNFTAISGFSPQLTAFWQELAILLEAARPNAPPIKLVEDGDASDEDIAYEPLKIDKKPPQRLDLSNETETELFRAHNYMRTRGQLLGQLLPYVENSRGIVTTAGGKYLPIFWVSLLMLRRTKCDLPVEIFLDDWTQYDAEFCEVTLPPLNARCRILSDIYNEANVTVPDHFQFKALSILFSSFQHILFLDADAFPAHNPTDLFSHPPYTTHGLVLWPDFWGLTVSPHYYHIAGIPEVPVSSRYSSETGQILLDKGVHKESLMMMVYYNYYGPDYYYTLLSQGGPGAGDKETFIPAAEVMDLPWYQVRRGIDALGQLKNGDFSAVAIAQNDPRADYIYKAPHPSHNYNHDSWPTAVDDPRNSPPPIPKPFFIHNSIDKLEPGKILRMDGPTRDDNGRTQRMYGGRDSLVQKFGYDVEVVLWEVISQVGCKISEELCEDIRNYGKETFGFQGKFGMH